MSTSVNSITPSSFADRESGYPKGVRIDVHEHGVETPIDTVEVTYFNTERGELCGVSALTHESKGFSFSAQKKGAWRHIFTDPMTEKPVFSERIKYDLRLSAKQ